MSYFYQKNQSVKLAPETVYGDGGASFTAIPAFLDAFPGVTLDKIENPIYVGTGNRVKFLAGSATQDITLKGFLKGSGTPGTAPEIAQIFKSSVMTEVISAGTSVTYSPASVTTGSTAMQVNLDGIQYVLSGSRVESLKITLQSKKLPEYEAKFIGLWSAPSGSVFVAPTFTNAAIQPQLAQSMQLTLGGNTFVIDKLEVTVKNKLEVEGDLNAVNRGVNEVAWVNREITGTITLKRDANSDISMWTNLIGSTELAVASVGFGPAGNKQSVSFAAFQVEDIKPKVMAGQHYYDITFRINSQPGVSTPAQEFSYTFA